MTSTGRSQLRRIEERGSRDSKDIHAILDAAFLAHVGFHQDGQPFVIPMIYGRQEDTLYLHGSAVSRLLTTLDAGVPACVTVTMIDGLVLARSAFHHSMNYRSVVAFGRATLVTDPAEKNSALFAFSEQIVRGRWEDVRQPTPNELRATMVLSLSLVEASA